MNLSQLFKCEMYIFKGKFFLNQMREKLIIDNNIIFSYRD